MSINQSLAEKFAAIPNIPDRRRAFLDEIVGFYNLNNRAIRSGGECVYSKTETSPGCAIGRCLSPELASEIDCFSDDDVENVEIRTVLGSSLSNKIPVWMREMGVDFLSWCQVLHDNESYWDREGITEEGKQFVLFGIEPLIN